MLAYKNIFLPFLCLILYECLFLMSDLDKLLFCISPHFCISTHLSLKLACPGCFSSQFPFTLFLCYSYFGYFILHHLSISIFQHIYPWWFVDDSQAILYFSTKGILGWTVGERGFNPPLHSSTARAHTELLLTYWAKWQARDLYSLHKPMPHVICYTVPCPQLKSYRLS